MDQSWRLGLYQVKTGIWYNQIMTDKKQPAAQGQRLTTEEIFGILRHQLPELASRYDIEYLGVFGSYVTGLVDHDSDLDILVEFENPPTLFQFVRLQNELSELLSLPVDLVMKTTLKPKIGEQILSEVLEV
ncbi:MAG: nucleotidyltransferase family protein [Candidatus Promineifilaceae bacterium]